MKWLLRIVAGLVVLILAAVAVLFLLPAEKIANLVTNQFEAATGRAMTLAGDVRPTLWPELGVKTGPVSIANADWSDAGPMLSAERLSIGVDIVALISGTIRIKRVEVDAPRILLEIAADGRGNWELAGAEAAVEATDGSADAGGLPEISLDRAVIDNGQVIFVDHSTGSRTELTNIDATIRLPDFRGTAELQMAAVMNGQAFSVDATIGAFADFLSVGAVPVGFAFAAGGSKVSFDGRAGLQPLAAGGRVDADLQDMAALFALLGMAAPAIPPGLGQTIGVSGEVTLTDTGGVTLRDGTIRLDQNVLTGAVDLLLGAERPLITARLAAGALDFASLTEGESSGDAAATGWSRDRIDASGLQAVDAEISLSADSIDLGLTKLGTTRIVTRLDAGRAVTEIAELSAYGGAVTGTVVVNSRGGLSTRASLTGSGIELQPLLMELAGYDRLLATGDVSINLLAVGDDMHALMSGLSGDGSVRLGQGELRGLDLAGMLRSFDTSFVGEEAKTIFDSIGGTFTVDGGVLSNDDLALGAPLLTASGAGVVGIGAQTLDYRLVPTLLEGQTNGGLKVPLSITGTWVDPKFQLDLKALAEQELADDIEALRDKAEEVVIDKLEEELGVTVENLDNVEDELKEELEDRVRDGLLDLLGGN